MLTNETSAQANCPDKVLLNCFTPGSDPDCFRMKFPYAIGYTGSQSPAPASFFAHSLRIEIRINGNGYFDEGLSNISSPIIGQGQAMGATFLTFSQDKKTAYLISPCLGNPSDVYEIPYGNCNDPLLELFVIADPGEIIEMEPMETSMEYYNPWIGGCGSSLCEISAYSFQTQKTSPVSCPSDLSLELWDMPSGPVDPHEEVTPAIRIYNNGTTPVTLTELDFRVLITDEENTLPDPELLPNYSPSIPEPEPLQNGDEYYYYLNALDPNNTIPPGGFITVLAMSILPPEGLENLFGQSNISVEFVRLNIEGGDCCVLDASSAKGTILFPGVLPCENTPLDDVSITVGPYLGGGLEDCEIAFAVYVNTPQQLQVERFLLELETGLSGNLMLKKIIPSGLTCTPTILCPSAAGGCLECGNSSILLDFEDPVNPMFLSDGDGFIVVLSGLNGSLDEVIFKKAALKLMGMDDACIPEFIIDAGFSQSLPMENGCSFCSNIFLKKAPYTGNLEACESGFSVKLDVGSPTQFDQITVQFIYETTGNILITDISTPICGSSGCLGQPQSCVTVDGNKITYQQCPGFVIGQEVTLLNIKFTGVGCIDGIVFTDETKVITPLQGECVPKDMTTANPFPVCNTCYEGMYMIGGHIQTENGNGVEILDEDPDEAIYITSTNCLPETTFSTCPDEEYNHNFICTEDAFFTIKPYKDVDPLNGVTTFDLVLITRHILGSQLLDSPYKIIAADANYSNSVTTFDLVEIRKLILFINPTFIQNTSWRFIDASYVFPNPANPWQGTFPEKINVDLSTQNAAINQDFIAVKIGDVNNSASVCSGFANDETGDRSQKARLYFDQGGNLPVKAGETLTLQFRLDSPEALVAWQMGVQFDPEALRLESALPDYLERFSPFKNLGATEASQGKLRLLWYDEAARPLAFVKDQDIFTLKFKVLHTITDLRSILSLDDEVLTAAGFREDGSTLSLEMVQWDSETALAAGEQPIDHLQATVAPNPFRDDLKFNIEMPEADYVDVFIFDAQGRIVANWSGYAKAGKIEVSFDRTARWGSGVFTWQVKAGRRTLSGTMVKE
jgi:hypothetical protein